MKPAQLYRYFDASGALLYIGSSINMFLRIQDARKWRPWFKDVTRITVIHFANVEVARAAEIAAIRSESPLYNVIHNRSKRNAA